jgi:catechol 2,3-dioxygenase-like lactoylglutathione lyase family enzyme
MQVHGWQLDAARVFVHDLATAHDFYARSLGLPRLAGGPPAGFCVYDAGGVRLVVEAVAPDASEDEHALVGRFTGLSFRVDDIQLRCAQLKARGVRLVAEPEPQPWGGVLATFADPANNLLQLVQRPGGG